MGNCCSQPVFSNSTQEYKPAHRGAKRTVLNEKSILLGRHYPQSSERETISSNKERTRKQHQKLPRTCSTHFVCSSLDGSSPESFNFGDTKNVLLVGPPKVGKSTCREVLVDPCWCPEADRSSSVVGISSTLNNKFHSPHSIKIEGNLQEYCVNFVEQSFGDNDPDFPKILKKCIKHGITHLNVVILLYPINKFTGREVKYVVEFANFFSQSGISLILCLTFGDLYNSQKCKTTCEEIQNHPDLINFFENKKLTLQIMGCVDYVHQDYFYEEQMKEKYLQISQWCKLCLQVIFMSNKKCFLSSLYS